MANNFFRNDTLENFQRIFPSSKEIAVVSDNAKHIIKHIGKLRIIAQLLEKGEGIEVRDWDEGAGKGNAGFHSVDLSTFFEKYGSGATGSFSFTTGRDTTAEGIFSSAFGKSTLASGESSHAEGSDTIASGDNSHTEGDTTTASGTSSHAEGIDSVASGVGSHAEGYTTTASGDNAHAEGTNTTASGDNAHAEGTNTTAEGDNAHAEGTNTTAEGDNAHAEGTNTTAEGDNSHAEGESTTASGINSHAEGKSTIASGDNSHAEGKSTIASGINSHAEGESTTASGINSHTEGKSTTASGDNSHSQGEGTKAINKNQVSLGSYNKGESQETILEVGIGTSDSDRKNALEILLNGNIRSPESTIQNLFSDLKALVTSEFVQEKISIENWTNEIVVTNTSSPVFNSDILETDKHANIFGVYHNGILLRENKFTYIISDGKKSVSLNSSVTIDEGDIICLQNNRVFYKDY